MKPVRVERGNVKYAILMALCAMQLIFAPASLARAFENAFDTDDRSPWYCFRAVAASEQDQSEADESEQQTEEEPDCD